MASCKAFRSAWQDLRKGAVSPNRPWRQWTIQKNRTCINTWTWGQNDPNFQVFMFMKILFVLEISPQSLTKIKNALNRTLTWVAVAWRPPALPARSGGNPFGQIITFGEPSLNDDFYLPIYKIWLGVQIFLFVCFFCFSVWGTFPCHGFNGLFHA